MEYNGLPEDVPPPAEYTGLVPPTEKDVALVVESGPIVYSDEEGLNEELIEEGLNDEEMKELAYEGDPLLHSDDEGKGRRVIMRCPPVSLHRWR